MNGAGVFPAPFISVSNLLFLTNFIFRLVRDFPGVEADRN